MRDPVTKMPSNRVIEVGTSRRERGAITAFLPIQPKSERPRLTGKVPVRAQLDPYEDFLHSD